MNAKAFMDRLQKVLILLMVAGIPAAAPPLLRPSSDLCFTAGSATYQLLPSASAADYRVRIVSGPASADVRIALVDRVEEADFALVDDVAAAPAKPCESAGLPKTVSVVRGEGRADVTVGFSREADAADFRLFVHSSRFGHQDAAALFVAMRHDRDGDRQLAGSD
jgi:hypothetical protein